MENEVLGIGRGYLLAFFIVGGFFALMIVLAANGTRMGDVEKWAEIVTSFAVPVLAIALGGKELGKLGQGLLTKRNGENK